MVTVLDTLAELVRNVALLILLAVFVELLLPTGDLSRFVRLVMGLFVLAAMLTSFWQILPRLGSAAANAPLAGLAAERVGIMRQAQSLEQYQKSAALDLYRQQLARQVTALVQGLGGLEVRRVEVALAEEGEGGAYGAIRRLTVEVRPQGDEPRPAAYAATPLTAGEAGQAEALAAVEEAKKKLSFFYGLAPEQVEVRVVE